MKTPEEIKKGLECCAKACEWDNGCPYMGLYDKCTEGLKSDALAYIRQLEAERDALLKYLTDSHWAACDICKHDIDGSGTMGCQHIHEVKGSCFEWRGLPEPPKGNGGKENDCK